MNRLIDKKFYENDKIQGHEIIKFRKQKQQRKSSNSDKDKKQIGTYEIEMTSINKNKNIYGLDYEGGEEEVKEEDI